MKRTAGARIVVLLAVTTVIVALASVAIGYAEISAGQLFGVLTGGGTDQQRLIVMRFRLPRIVLGLTVGAGLAAAGIVLQGVAGNELAEPGIIGINAGAGFSVVLTLYAVSDRESLVGLASAPPHLMPVAAFAGAATTAFLIFALASRKGAVTPIRLLLVGIAVNAAVTAATLVAAMRLDRRLYDVAVNWLSGSVAGVGWAEAVAPIPWLLVAMPIIARYSRTLDALAFGDDVATGLGISVRRARWVLIATATAVSAATVAVAGGIAFIGLLGPHIARRLVGRRNGIALPAAMLTGAILVAGGDLIARTLFSPAELPVGVVVSALGAPYFLWLLMRLRSV